MPGFFMGHSVHPQLVMSNYNCQPGPRNQPYCYWLWPCYRVHRVLEKSL